MELQPLLHDLLVATMAPTQAWSGLDGQVRPHGAQGFYHCDVRVLSRAVLTVDGREPEVIRAGPVGVGVVEVIALLRGVDEPGADPTVRLRRTRRVTPGTVRESLEVGAATVRPVRVPIAVHLACDLAVIEEVKTGRETPPHPGRSDGGGVVWSDGDEEITVRGSGGCQVDVSDPSAPVLTWTVEVRPGAPTTLEWGLVAATQPGAVVQPAPSAATWSSPVLRADDRRLTSLLGRGLEDLSTLRMSAAFAPQDVILASGAPWYFTLFGRASIQVAGWMLPLGTELAAGTLRTVAARQGTTINPVTCEQPGKILHEVRRDTRIPRGSDGWALPPLYYGTIDATPLWVCLLHDAWRWGLAAAEIEALLPAMEAALRWMGEYGDADGDRFLEYLDPTGRGLANQGWKDSGDAVQWRDGSLAIGPIALCEVQAYAYQAALGRCCVAGGLRPAGGRTRADMGDTARRALPRAVLGHRPRRPLPGDRARRSQTGGRHPHQQHRSSSRHGTARRRGGGRGRPTSRLARDGLRVRAADAVSGLRRLLAAAVPRGHGLDP